MTTLREASQQALEALEYGQHTLKQVSESQWESRGELAMQALRAALAEPVQDPVAWMHTDPDNTFVCFLEWRENEPGYRGSWIKTPLYTARTQRKPLTQEEAIALWSDKSDGPSNSEIVSFARAIERAHGIGEQQ